MPTALTSSYDFGSCSNPGIIYGFGFDSQSRYAFEPVNLTQFPHNSSLDIATIESYICNHLATVCGASTQAQSACQNAYNMYSGYEGQNAADSWNSVLNVTFEIDPLTYTSRITSADMTSTNLVTGQPASPTSTPEVSIGQSNSGSTDSTLTMGITTSTDYTQTATRKATSGIDVVNTPVSSTAHTASGQTQGQTGASASAVPANSNGSPFVPQYQTPLNLASRINVKSLVLGLLAIIALFTTA